MKSLAALVLGCALAAPALAQYKWTAPDGSTAYGDRPPVGARDVQKLGSGAAPGANDPLQGLPFELRRAAQSFPVRLYTTPGCAPCDAGREALRARGVPFEERTVVSRADLEALLRLGHGGDLPLLTVGRQAQRGFEPRAWMSVLDAAGYPAASQLPRNWQPATPRPITEGTPPASAPAPATAAPETDPATRPPPPEPTRGGPTRF